MCPFGLIDDQACCSVLVVVAKMSELDMSWKIVSNPDECLIPPADLQDKPIWDVSTKENRTLYELK